MHPPHTTVAMDRRVCALVWESTGCKQLLVEMDDFSYWGVAGLNQGNVHPWLRGERADKEKQRDSTTEHWVL